MIATETPKFPPGRGKGVPGRILSEPCGREEGEEGQVEIPVGKEMPSPAGAGGMPDFRWDFHRNAEGLPAGERGRPESG